MGKGVERFHVFPFFIAVFVRVFVDEDCDKDDDQEEIT